LSYLHAKNLKYRNILTPIQIMNIVGINSKNIMNSVGNFNDNVAMNSIFIEVYGAEHLFL
jgi:hypothetical protein